MITRRLFTGIICLLLVGSFLGCQDHQWQGVTPGANRLRIKTITQQVTTSASVSTVSAFSYDTQGRLSLITAYQIPDSTVAPVENTVYQYDSQNRLTQVNHSIVRRGSRGEIYTLNYNGSGQLSQLANNSFYLTPHYNPANQLTGYGKAISVSGLQSSGGGAFIFTGNNLTNVTESFSVYRSGESPSAPPAYSRSTNTVYTFDTKTNPFYGRFIIPAPGVFLPYAGSGSFGPFYSLYGGIDNFFNLSQNNVLSAVNAGGTTSYSYTYNVSNLPTSRTTTTPAGVTEVLRYEYEPY